MTNLEIDRKLADKMRYDKNGLFLATDDDGNYILWHPTTNMVDAWAVAEHFGFRYLRKNTLTGKYQAYLQFANEKADTAPMAICLAALQLIEGSKSDE
jgi:hypothetical protein